MIRAFDFHAAAETVEAGRDAITLSAVSVLPDDCFLFGLELVTLGAAEYTITIDGTYGIVLAWTALINGMYGKGQTLSDVKIDGPIDESAFTGPS